MDGNAEDGVLILIRNFIDGQIALSRSGGARLSVPQRELTAGPRRLASSPVPIVNGTGNWTSQEEGLAILEGASLGGDPASR
jgi:hypothetical protein